MAETVLVSGGSGFVASWCIVDLLKRGYTVRTTVRNLAKEPAVRAAIASIVDPGDRLATPQLQFGQGPGSAGLDPAPRDDDRHGVRREPDGKGAIGRNKRAAP